MPPTSAVEVNMTHIGWEYKSVEVPIKIAIKTMNEVGLENWRVINVRHIHPRLAGHRALHPGRTLVDTVIILCEREIPHGMPEP